jgi:sugar phosphate isomerase/epimerase
MDNPLSFNCANFVARELGYSLAETVAEWARADRATQDAFAHPDAFGPRFAALLDDVAALGFRHVDLWLAHLHPSWAGPEHVALAREALDRRGIRAVSLGGRLGETRAELERTCALAHALGAGLLVGRTGLLGTDALFVRAQLAEHGLVLGLENHPERSPQELLAQLPADADGLVGAGVDTGWFGTQGYDAACAIEELGDLVVYVHLKDVRAAGAHETCRFGDGVVPVERCVEALRRIGYSAPISVEHEPPDRDPSGEVVESAERLRRWLAT